MLGSNEVQERLVSIFVRRRQNRPLEVVSLRRWFDVALSHESDQSERGVLVEGVLQVAGRGRGRVGQRVGHVQGEAPTFRCKGLAGR